MVLVTDNDHCQKTMAVLWEHAKIAIGTDATLQYDGQDFHVHSCLIKLASRTLLQEWSKVSKNETINIVACGEVTEFVQKSNVDLSCKSQSQMVSKKTDLNSRITADIFERILKFMYTGEIDIPDNSFGDIESFAKVCEIEKLIAICEIYNEKQKDINEEESVTVFVEPEGSVVIPEITEGLKTYKCSDCEQIFSNASCLSEHCVLFRHGIVDEFPPCKDCSTVFYSKLEIENHACPKFLGEITDKDEVCTYCLLPCDNILELQEHESLHKCEPCNKIFGTIQSRHSHICGIHNEKLVFDCTQCSKHYTSKQCFVNHQKKHVGGTGLICKYCDKVFLHYLPLKKHVLSHTEDTNFKHECRVCSQKFKLKIKFYSHCIKFNHMIPEVPYKCTFCKSLFSNERDLNSHERIHSPAKAFQCGECDKTYNSRLGLKLHINSIHLKKLPCKCDECGKQFAQQSHLTDHMRTHTKLKMYMCSICGLAVSSKVNLKRHENTHTGNKELGCNWCSKKYSIPYDLNRHIKRKHPNCEDFRKNGEIQVDTINFEDVYMETS